MDLTVVNNLITLHLRIEYLIVLVVLVVMIKVLHKGKS